jgi:hypothetical protein
VPPGQRDEYVRIKSADLPAIRSKNADDGRFFPWSSGKNAERFVSCSEYKTLKYKLNAGRIMLVRFTRIPQPLVLAALAAMLLATDSSITSAGDQEHDLAALSAEITTLSESDC